MSVAIVTGGGSGVGEAAARALAAADWTVVVAGRRPEPLDAVAEVDGIGAHVADVTREDDVRGLFDHVVQTHGRVDLLFNNAGSGAPAVDLDQHTLADWQRVVDVNLTGMFLCTREAFRVMRSQKPAGGRIINNGSIAAHSPRPRSIAYTATKHAVTGMTKATALDGRPFGIACGQIDIGNAETDMARGSADGALQPDGSTRPEPLMDVADVGRAIAYMAGLPLDANVATMTVMATTMPYLGRG